MYVFRTGLSHLSWLHRAIHSLIVKWKVSLLTGGSWQSGSSRCCRALSRSWSGLWAVMVCRYWMMVEAGTSPEERISSRTKRCTARAIAALEGEWGVCTCVGGVTCVVHDVEEFMLRESTRVLWVVNISCPAARRLPHLSLRDKTQCEFLHRTSKTRWFNTYRHCRPTLCCFPQNLLKGNVLVDSHNPPWADRDKDINHLPSMRNKASQIRTAHATGILTCVQRHRVQQLHVFPCCAPTAA